MKKITFINAAGKTRLHAIQMIQNGETQADVAKKFNVHYTTIAEWQRMYEEGGAVALNVPLKPRSTTELSADDLKSALSTEPDTKKRTRLNRLLRTITEPLNSVASSEGVSPQAIMKDRRKFIEKGSL